MPDEAPPAEKVSPDLVKRVERMEELLTESESLRRRTRWFSLIGALLVLGLLMLFVGRIVGHFRSEYYVHLKNDPGAFLQEIAKEVELDKVLKQQADQASRELTNRIIPDFSKRVVNEAKARSGEIEKEVYALGGKIGTFAQESAQKRLEELMVKSLDQSYEEVHKVFPSIEQAAWEKQVAQSKDLFVEELVPVLEERVARVTACLEGLKHAAEIVGQSGGDLKDTDRHLLEQMLLDALIDAAYFELKPDTGKELAPPPVAEPSAVKAGPKGGAK